MLLSLADGRASFLAPAIALLTDAVRVVPGVHGGGDQV